MNADNPNCSPNEGNSKATGVVGSIWTLLARDKKASDQCVDIEYAIWRACDGQTFTASKMFSFLHFHKLHRIAATSDELVKEIFGLRMYDSMK